MRAVYVLLLAVVALAFVAPVVTAQPPPPRNGSWIAMFNDSDCHHHIHNMVVPLPSSSKCVPEHYRHHNESATFQCTTANNQTDLSFNFYNNTATCDNTAVVSYESSAPAHTCAPIKLTYEGQSLTLYGHIRCEDERESVLSDAAATARFLMASKPQPAEVKSGLTELLERKYRASKLIA